MLTRFKIFVFTDNFAPITETFVYDHVVRLARHHEVQLGCLQQLNNDIFPFGAVHQFQYRESRIRKIIRSRLYKHHIRLNYFNPGLKKCLTRFLKDFQPDLIHCHFGNKALMFLDNLDAGVFSGPIFLTFYGYDASLLLKKRPAYRNRIKRILQRDDIYPIMVSSHLLSNLKNYGIVSPRSRVIHLGTDTGFFAPKPRTAESKYVFLQIAGFREKKGHAFTLRAFAQLMKTYPDHPWKLIFGGSGPLEQSMKDLAGDLGIGQNVEFKGWINKFQARELLQKADAFLHFSLTSDSGDQEGLPVAITEAMAMELPVCATEHSGIPELVEHGVNGLLVTEKDINAYMDAMKDIILWGRQPQNRLKVIAHFSHKSYIDKELTDAYIQAVNHWKKAGV